MSACESWAVKPSYWILPATKEGYLKGKACARDFLNGPVCHGGTGGNGRGEMLCHLVPKWMRWHKAPVFVLPAAESLPFLPMVCRQVDTYNVVLNAVKQGIIFIDSESVVII